MKTKKIILVLAIIMILIISVSVYNTMNKENTSIVDKIDISINTDNGDEKIDWSKYQNIDYELKESITITEDGIYKLTGTIPDGLITVNTNGNIKLILNNVNITNTSGPAIYVANAEDVIIELAENSHNYLEDGNTYTGFETDIIGTIFSHDDITFQGTGELEIKSNNEDAIVSKDDLKIISGTYKINSKDDGIRGKDSVYIQDGTFTINSGGDAIKSTNNIDEGKGYILIENGTFNINATLDGLQSEKKLLIENGVFNITTGGGSTISSTNSSWGKWGYSNVTSDTLSAKGIKAGDNLVIEDGTFTFNTSDDAVHCNNYIGIKNGNLNIKSGDDGIHADTELIIDGGNIDITKSYEGLESSKITINGGIINVISEDDGINVAGGNDSSATGRPGENHYSSNTDNILTISGGTIYVDSRGDGIDVNGSGYIYDGYIKVDGPTDNGNGAIDYDGTFEVNSGTLLAGGSSGMLQGCSSSSSIYNLKVTFTSNYGDGDKIIILDSSGNQIISYESSKTYSSLIVASPSLKKEETYSIKVNNEEYKTFKISNITTTIGSWNGGNQGVMSGGRR